MTRFIFPLVFLAAAVSFISAGNIAAQPKEIAYMPGPEGRYPESLAYDARSDRFIVSSSTGQLGSVDRSGRYSVFAEDADMNPSTGGAGVYVDLTQNRVYSVQNDFGGGNTSILAVHSTDGKLIKVIDLDELHSGARTFANVIRVAEGGTAYITDSWSPVIYAIDRDLNARVFLEDKKFATSAPFNAQGQALFGAAGLALKNNTLFITHSEAVKLYKIKLDEPLAVVEVPYDGSKVPPLVDGIVFLNDRELAMITNWSKTVVVLATNDNWRSAALTNKVWYAPAGMPTEGDLVNGELAVINSHFDSMIASFSGGPHREKFEIHFVDFSSTQ